MTVRYPVSEQLARGAEFLEAVLVETPLATRHNGDSANVQTEALPLETPWGPFTHTSLRGELESTSNGHGLIPSVELAMRLDPEVGDGGMVGHIRYEELAATEDDFSGSNKLADVQHGRLKPAWLSLEYRPVHDKSECPADRSVIKAIDPLGVSAGEMRPDAQVVVEFLKQEFDILEGLGSTGLVLALRAEQPESTPA